MIKRLKAKRTSQTDKMTKHHLTVNYSHDQQVPSENARLLADCDIYALRKELSVND
jgi:hypothetical protein